MSYYYDVMAEHSDNLLSILSASSKPNLVIIDGDLIAFKIACILEKEKASIVTPINLANRLYEYLLGTLNRIYDVHSVHIAFSSGRNFRFNLNTEYEYKGNRDSSKKPLCLPEVVKVMKNNLLTYVMPQLETDEYEGDDYISDLYSRKKDTYNIVIVSDDKDFYQLPDVIIHRYSKPEIHKVTYEQAVKNFFTQVLIGDTADNVIGIKGLGEKKAKDLFDKYLPAIITGQYTEEDLYQAYFSLCACVYISCYTGTINQFIWNKRNVENYVGAMFNSRSRRWAVPKETFEKAIKRLYDNCTLLHLVRDSKPWEPPTTLMGSGSFIYQTLNNDIHLI